MGLLDVPALPRKAAVPWSRPAVRNRKNLGRFETALATKANPVITVLGNSISWGVGADGTGTTTSGFYEVYRQNAWPVLLRKLLAARGGALPSENFVMPCPYGGYLTLNGTTDAYGTTGPFGVLTQGGGVRFNAVGDSFDIPASKLGAFTELDVLYWGTPSGTAGYSPLVKIDDVQVDAGGVVSASNIAVTTITGLSDAPHKVTVQATLALSCWPIGVVARRPSGIVVNRIAFPGAKAYDVPGYAGGYNTQQQNRQIDCATLAGYSDLVIIQFTANEVYQQTPLTDFQTALNAIIARVTAAGGCVLLLGDPMVNGEEGSGYTIHGSQYRAVMQSISDSNQYVAYADMNAVFGDRASGETVGMWPGGTVHPALEGHRRMADFILHDVLPLPLISSTVGGPDDNPFTAAQKTKLAGIATGATANSTEATAATASTIAVRDAQANLVADAFVPGVTSTATAGGTTTLDADSVEVQIFTGSSGQTVVLPSVARRLTIINLSSASLTLNASGGGNIGAVPTQNIVTVVAKQSTPTVAADWSANFTATYSHRTSATSGTVAVRDGNTNLLAGNFIPTKASTATAATTTTLTIDSTQVQEFTGSTTQTVKLPTTSVTAGMEYRIINNSSGVVTVQSSGANTITTVAAGSAVLFMAQVDTPTTAANWRYFAATG